MEELTKEQKRMFDRFIKVFSTEDSLKSLDRLLASLENREIENTLNEIKEIQQKMQGNKENGEISIKEAIEDIHTAQKDIDELYWKIFDLKEDGQDKSSVEKEIESIKQFAIKMRESYRRFYDTQDSEGNVTQGLITKLDEACKKIEGNKDKFDRIDKYYIELFEGIQGDENGNDKKPSLEKFIEDFKTQSKSLIEDKRKLIDQLLPGATSARLASAYQKEKQNIEAKLDGWQKIFWGSVITFIICFGVYFWKTFDEGFTYVSFLKSLPFWVFSGFFTFFSTKQISEYKRLVSEYAYKEALNATYMGYEKAIQESNNQELKERLLKTVIQAAEFNPSITLGKTYGDHPVSSFVDKAKDFLSSNTKTEKVDMD